MSNQFIVNTEEQPKPKIIFEKPIKLKCIKQVECDDNYPPELNQICYLEEINSDTYKVDICNGYWDRQIFKECPNEFCWRQTRMSATAADMNIKYRVSRQSRFPEGKEKYTGIFAEVSIEQEYQPQLARWFPKYIELKEFEDVEGAIDAAKEFCKEHFANIVKNSNRVKELEKQNKELVDFAKRLQDKLDYANKYARGQLERLKNEHDRHY